MARPARSNTGARLRVVEEDDLIPPMGENEDDGDKGNDVVEIRRIEDFACDDTGNAKRLIAAFGDDLRFILDRQEWVVWNEATGLWEQGQIYAEACAKKIAEAMQARAKQLADHNRHLRQTGRMSNSAPVTLFSKHASQSGNTPKILSMLRNAISEDGVAVEDEVFDSNTELLAVKGRQVLELTSSGAKVRRLERDDYCRYACAVRYDPDAKSDKLDAYLDLFMPDLRIREWLQRLLGASIVGGNKERMIVFAWGESTSGKGMLGKMIKAAFGGYFGPFNLSLFKDSQTESSRADIVAALPRRIIVADEAARERQLHADQVKRITGDGVLQARLPHRAEEIERIPAFVPWVLCNHPPSINGRDRAINNRIRVVPFRISLNQEDEDTSIASALASDPEAMTAFLAWIVEGYNNYCKKGLKDCPPIVEQARKRLLGSLSTFDEFVTETCESKAGDAEYFDSVTLLRNAYFVWCDENEIPRWDRLSGNTLGRRFVEAGYPDKLKRTKTVKKGETTYLNVRCRVGVRLVDEWRKRAENYVSTFG